MARAALSGSIPAIEAVALQFHLRMMKIRAVTEADRDAVWNIFYETTAPGDTYAFDPKMSREEALAYWFRTDTHTYVAEKDSRIVGTYILRPNQLGPGSHVANAA